MMVRRLILVLAGVLAVAASAQARELGALHFYADWCASCKVLDPKAMPILERYAASDGVDLVRLDLTERSDDHQAAQRQVAEAHGAVEIFDRFAPATGLIVLYDRDTAEAFAVINQNFSPEEIDAALVAALKGEAF